MENFRLQTEMDKLMIERVELQSQLSQETARRCKIEAKLREAYNREAYKGHYTGGGPGDAVYIEEEKECLTNVERSDFI